MPFVYDISAGNPEGIDYLINLEHDEYWDKDEFDKMVEEAFVYALKKQIEVDQMCFVACCSEYLVEYLTTKLGFRIFDTTQSYHLEPYWNREQIKNQELLKLINKE